MASHALVPVNRLTQAKGRLASLLSPSEREDLALSLATTAVEAAVDAGFAVIVLTADPAVRAAVPLGVRVLAERDDRHGLNAQLEAAVATIAADELLILHADLPLVSGRSLRSLLAVAFAAPSATLVESADGGTNAMVLRPPGRFPLAYGPGSAAVHRSRALAAGLLPLTLAEPALALDLDTPADVRRLLATPDGRAAPAGRLLLGWNVTGRMFD